MAELADRTVHYLEMLILREFLDRYRTEHPESACYVDAWLAHVDEGIPYNEWAARHGKSPAAVYQGVNRMLNKAKAYLESF